MAKKKRLFYFLSVIFCPIILIGMVLVYINSFDISLSRNYRKVKGTASYSINLQKDNDVKNGVITQDGNVVNFTYSGLGSSGSNITLSTDGYFYNPRKLSGIQTLSFTISSGSLEVYYGEFDGNNYLWYWASDISSTGDVDLSSYKPNYLKVIAKSSSAFKVVVNYECDDEYIPQDGEYSLTGEYKYNHQQMRPVVSAYPSSFTVYATVRLVADDKKPGFLLKDANNNPLYIYGWDNGNFWVNDNGTTSGSDPLNTIYSLGSNIKDSSHLSNKMFLTYDCNTNNLYFRVDTYATDNFSTVTNTAGVVIPISTISTKTGRSYDFSTTTVYTYNSSWSEVWTEAPNDWAIKMSDITITRDADFIKNAKVSCGDSNNIASKTIDSDGNLKVNFDTRHGYTYIPDSSNSVYLKLKIDMTYAYQGITLYTDNINGNNAQIGFQHYGYSIMKNYTWAGFFPSEENQGIFHYNGSLGFQTDNVGEHTIEYFIHNGKLYITYDSTNIFNRPLNFSELSDAFTSTANYHIGLYSYDHSCSMVVEDYAFGDAAIAEYTKNIPANSITKNSDVSYTITGDDGIYITNYAAGSFTVSAHFNQSVDFTVNGFYLIDNNDDNVQFVIWGNSGNYWINRNNDGSDGGYGLTSGNEFDFTLAFNANTQTFTLTKTVSGSSNSADITVATLNTRYSRTYDFSKCYVGLASNNVFGDGPNWDGGIQGPTTVTNYSFTNN